jgi:small subunit ribosomal protein S1
VPTGLDEYLAEHKVGDRVTGRLIEISSRKVLVELGEGVHADCRISAERGSEREGNADKVAAAKAMPGKPDLSSLGSMLQARWKSGAPLASEKTEDLRVGQVRNFRIAKIDAGTKTIELDLN